MVIEDGEVGAEKKRAIIEVVDDIVSSCQNFPHQRFPPSSSPDRRVSTPSEHAYQRRNMATSNERRHYPITWQPSVVGNQ